jgi:hypothetical protein
MKKSFVLPLALLVLTIAAKIVVYAACTATWNTTSISYTGCPILRKDQSWVIHWSNGVSEGQSNYGYGDC